MTDDLELSTRQQVLALVVERGPVTAAQIAARLALTPAAVRRHTSLLLEEGQIADHGPTGAQAPRRGRPARYFVATDAAHEDLTDASAELATEALTYLRDVAGEDAVVAFLTARTENFADRYARLLERDGGGGADGAPLEQRVRVLAEALNEEGFAATVREIGDGYALQLCQGHCPVLAVAEDVPALCEIETEAFARILDIHVQRLATLAGGGHVCTTHIPLAVPAPKSAPAAPTPAGAGARRRGRTG